MAYKPRKCFFPWPAFETLRSCHRSFTRPALGPIHLFSSSEGPERHCRPTGLYPLQEQQRPTHPQLYPPALGRNWDPSSDAPCPPILPPNMRLEPCPALSRVHISHFADVGRTGSSNTPGPADHACTNSAQDSSIGGSGPVDFRRGSSPFDILNHCSLGNIDGCRFRSSLLRVVLFLGVSSFLVLNLWLCCKLSA